jgi:hypothetical protein
VRGEEWCIVLVAKIAAMQQYLLLQLGLLLLAKTTRSVTQTPAAVTEARHNGSDHVVQTVSSNSSTEDIVNNNRSRSVGAVTSAIDDSRQGKHHPKSYIIPISAMHYT